MAWARLATVLLVLGLGGVTSVAAAPASSDVEAPPFDPTYADWNAVLDGAVSAQGAVDYARIGTRKDRLDAFVASLASADPQAMSTEARVAFWVNAYNAITVKLMLDEGLPDSIRSLDMGLVWKTRTWRVGGETVTLDGLEHQRIRPLTDGRVHAVINCASKGCPPLPVAAVRGQALDAQLDAGARRWAATNGWSMEGDTLRVSKIFDWYRGDFTDWTAEDVPGATAAQAHAVAFLRAHGAALPPFARVAWQPYDWSRNGP